MYTKGFRGVNCLRPTSFFGRVLPFAFGELRRHIRCSKEKRKALSEWVSAVNSMGEYGEWCNDVSYNIADVDGIIAKYI